MRRTNATKPEKQISEPYLAMSPGLVVCTVVIYASYGYISRLWNITSPAAHIPMRYVFAALPVGCGLMIFFTIVHLIAGPPQHPHDPASEHLS